MLNCRNSERLIRNTTGGHQENPDDDSLPPFACQVAVLANTGSISLSANYDEEGTLSVLQS